MTKKTFVDECLERAEKATPGPWELDKVGSNISAPEFMDDLGNDRHDLAYVMDNFHSAQFIAHARTAVPELARRLKRACEVLRDNAIYWKNAGAEDSAYALNKVADELEKPIMQDIPPEFEKTFRENWQDLLADKEEK